MNKLFILISILFFLIYFLRVFQVGGLTKSYSDPELENLASGFEPFRNFLADKVDQILPQPQAALLSGILLGVKSSLPKDFNNALKRTSTIHIVVVSGQNLSLLIGFLIKIHFFIGRRKTIFICFLAIILYSLLTGLQIPVVRAALMVGLALLAQLFGREKDSAWILVLTAFMMLIYQPNWLLSVSFQLSFLATLGVIVVAPVIVKSLTFLPNLIKQDFGVSLAAQALTWPIIASNFHQASLVGIFVNSLVLWTISPVMIGGIIALILAYVSPILGVLAVMPSGVLLTFFVYIVNFFNSLPFASISVGSVHWIVWFGYYTMILGIFLWLKKSDLIP